MLGGGVGHAVHSEWRWIPLAQASLANRAILWQRVAPEKQIGELVAGVECGAVEHGVS